MKKEEEEEKATRKSKGKRYSPTPSLPALRCVCALLGNVAASLTARPLLMQTAAVGRADSHAHSGVRLSAHDWAYQVAIKDQLWCRDAVTRHRWESLQN